VESNTDKAAKGAPKEPPKYDWVTERSRCSLPKVFHTLRMQVEEDVKTRNALRPENSPYEFSVTENIDEFAVVLQAKEVRESISFRLAEHTIVVRDDKSNPLFDVIATFSEDGKCKLYVNEAERDFWQVRWMALEGLMFRGS
jgi:hypothetical protein